MSDLKIQRSSRVARFSWYKMIQKVRLHLTPLNPTIFVPSELYKMTKTVKYSETAGSQTPLGYKTPPPKKQDDLRQGQTLSECLSSVWLFECSFPLWAHTPLIKVCVNMTALQILQAPRQEACLFPQLNRSNPFVWCTRKGTCLEWYGIIFKFFVFKKRKTWIKMQWHVAFVPKKNGLSVSHYLKHSGCPAVASEARPSCSVFPGLLQIPPQYHHGRDSSSGEQSNK